MFNPFKNWSALFDVSANHRSSLDAWRAIAMYWIVTKHSMQVIMAYRNTPQVTNSMLENQIYKPIFLAEFGVDVFFCTQWLFNRIDFTKRVGENWSDRCLAILHKTRLKNVPNLLFYTHCYRGFKIF